MSDIIEERLKDEYCNLDIEVKKYDFKSYEITIKIDWNKGFKFVYPWFERLTYDSNVERIVSSIDDLLLKYFKKVR